MRRRTKVAIGAGALLAGAGAAYLYGTKKGAKTRKKISAAAKKGAKKATKIIANAEMLATKAQMTTREAQRMMQARTPKRKAAKKTAKKK